MASDEFELRVDLDDMARKVLLECGEATGEWRAALQRVVMREFGADHADDIVSFVEQAVRNLAAVVGAEEAALLTLASQTTNARATFHSTTFLGATNRGGVLPPQLLGVLGSARDDEPARPRPDRDRPAAPVLRTAPLPGVGLAEDTIRSIVVVGGVVVAAAVLLYLLLR